MRYLGRTNPRSRYSKSKFSIEHEDSRAQVLFPDDSFIERLWNNTVETRFAGLQVVTAGSYYIEVVISAGTRPADRMLFLELLGVFSGLVENSMELQVQLPTSRYYLGHQSNE